MTVTKNIVLCLRTLKFLIRHITFTPYLLWFNFRHLPFKQAIKLPIFILSRNKSLKKGKVIIASEKITTGMIKIGFRSYLQHPIGATFSNKGGTVVFEGSCFITNNSSLIISKDGYLSIGNKVGISTTEIKCASSIEINSGTMIGINCLIMDSDFHPVIDIYAQKAIKMSKSIKIGRNNWLGAGTYVLKGTQTPDNIIVGARSVLNKKYKVPEFSIIGMKQSAEFIDEGYCVDFNYDISQEGNRKLTQEEIEKILSRKRQK